MFENFENRNFINEAQAGRSIVPNPFKEGTMNFSQYPGVQRREMEANKVLTLANAEIDELTQALNHAEMKLASTLKDKELIEQQKRDQTYQVSNLNHQLRKRDSEAQQRDNMYKDLENQLRSKDRNQGKILDQTQCTLNNLSKEISFREEEISSLRYKIKSREMHCDAALISDTVNRHEKAKLQNSNLDKDQQIQDLNKKLFETQKQLDEAVLGRKSEGTALLQSEHYRQDNERLIKLLASTKEFQNFGEFAADSGDGVRYLDPQKTSNFPQNESKLKSFKAGEEMEDWIPEEAFKVAHDFRNRCAAQVSQSLMNQFLKDLNKIWKQREDKQIARIKSECNREVQFLRRQVQFKKPYDKVAHQSDVKRLQNEIKSTKAALRGNVAVITGSEKGSLTDGLLVVDQTVKYTNEIQMERRRLQEEKDALQSQIDRMNLERGDEVKEKEKFYEGASWLGRQSLNQAETAVNKIETIKLEYLKKVTDAGNDEFMRGRAAEWLLDSAQRVTQQTKDESQRLMENAMRNN